MEHAHSHHARSKRSADPLAVFGGGPQPVGEHRDPGPFRAACRGCLLAAPGKFRFSATVLPPESGRKLAWETISRQLPATTGRSLAWESEKSPGQEIQLRSAKFSFFFRALSRLRRRPSSTSLFAIRHSSFAR